MANLYSLRATVTMLDGTELAVVAINPDLIRYEDVARQRGWGGPDTQPIRWTTYVAWAALKRTGQVSADFDVWHLEVANIDAVTDEPVDPTGPAPDSS